MRFANSVLGGFLSEIRGRKTHVATRTPRKGEPVASTALERETEQQLRGSKTGWPSPAGEKTPGRRVPSPRNSSHTESFISASPSWLFQALTPHGRQRDTVIGLKICFLADRCRHERALANGM
ncbi:uncharacterized protein LOC143648547 [Tamandua tetradactyla]|uniref:uncharacterized protein LOC143648547 n=1 Tax=Tamandua tetradactyla TaxID=48850 RepID=UPI004053BBCC